MCSYEQEFSGVSAIPQWWQDNAELVVQKHQTGLKLHCVVCGEECGDKTNKSATLATEQVHWNASTLCYSTAQLSTEEQIIKKN